MHHIQRLKLDYQIELVTLVVFCWLTMSWGGYVGAISIVLYVSFRSFFNNELNFLFQKSDEYQRNTASYANDNFTTSSVVYLGPH